MSVKGFQKNYDEYLGRMKQSLLELGLTESDAEERKDLYRGMFNMDTDVNELVEDHIKRYINSLDGMIHTVTIDGEKTYLLKLFERKNDWFCSISNRS